MSSPGRRASYPRGAAGPVDSLLQAAPGKIDEDAGQAEVPAEAVSGCQPVHGLPQGSASHAKCT